MILAARVAAEAAGGQVLVAEVVRQLVAGKALVFAERGTPVVPGFTEPVPDPGAALVGLPPAAPTP